MNTMENFKNAIEALVAQTAADLIHESATSQTTTLEVKNRLRQTFQNYNLDMRITQSEISDIMNTLYLSGLFAYVDSNKGYRIYYEPRRADVSTGRSVDVGRFRDDGAGAAHGPDAGVARNADAGAAPIVKKTVEDILEEIRDRQFFTVVFEKENGEMRKLNGRLLSNFKDSIIGDLVKVVDVKRRKTHPNDAIRQFRKDRIKSLTVKGITHVV